MWISSSPTFDIGIDFSDDIPMQIAKIACTGKRISVSGKKCSSFSEMQPVEISGIDTCDAEKLSQDVVIFNPA